MVEDRLEPFVVGAVDGDAAGPFLVLDELVVGLRQVGGLDQIGVVGGRIVVGVKPVPAPARIARLGQDGLGFRRIERRELLGRNLVEGGGLQDVPGLLAGAELHCHAGHQRRVVAAHVRNLDAGGFLENLE